MTRIEPFYLFFLFSTPEKCIKSTKEFGDKLIKALQPHLIEVLFVN